MWILVSAVAGLAGLLFGYQTAVVAGALDFVTREFALSVMAQQVVVASILVGAFVGASLSGKLADRFGQKPTLLGTALIFIMGAIGCSQAGSYAWLVVARGLLGLAVGSASAIAPLYVSETAPPQWRGALVSMVQLAVTVGILISYLVSYAFTSSGNWRAMFALGAVPAVVLLLGMLALPESPRWLLLKGRRDEALRAFARLGLPVEEGGPSEEPGGTLAELLSPTIRPVVVVAAGLFLFQNLSGIDGILYYAPELFKQVGFDGQKAAILATAGVGTINVLATIVAMGLVDRLGRRPLLLGGLVVMVASLAVFAYTLGKGESAPGLAVGCLAVYVAAFALSLGPLPYVMMAELFPLNVRSLGMSVASATSWGTNIVVSLTFLTLLQLLGSSRLFWVYGGICAVALVFSVLMVPETRGCSLEEIEAHLRAGKPPRRLGER